MSFSATQIPDPAGRKPGTLIHLGAGRCRELDVWRDAGFKQIVLVEADQAQTAEMTRRLGRDNQVRIIEQAVSAEDGTGILNILNYPDANSLRSPTQLLELFPGVRLHKRVTCSVRGVNDLISDLELDSGAFNGLVIETPGEEYAIAKALAQGDQLDLLSFVLVQAPTVPLYEGARSITEVESLLLEVTFQIQQTDPSDQDSIRSIRSFRRDVAAIHRHQLENQFMQERAKRQRLEEKLAEAIAELGQKEITLKKAQIELQEARASGVEIKSVKAELQRARDERAEFEEKSNELKHVAAAQKARAEQLEKKLKEVEKKKADAESQITRATEKISELEMHLSEREKSEAELKKAWEERGKYKADAEKKEAEAAEANKRTEHLEQELREAQDEIQHLKIEASSRPRITDELQKLLQNQSEQIEKSVQLQKENAETLEKRFLNRILSRVDNSAKQVESYIQLNSFFDRGELLPDLHGWPISPDLAVYLMRAIKQDDYDLIIEFGSGS
jgi:hypothetical protein